MILNSLNVYFFVAHALMFVLISGNGRRLRAALPRNTLTVSIIKQTKFCPLQDHCFPELVLMGFWQECFIMGGGCAQDISLAL